jgi:hypothetical protein
MSQLCQYGWRAILGQKEITMHMNLIARIVAGMIALAALSGCFSSSKEVVHDQPVYQNPPSSTTVVVPPANP